MIGGNEFIGSFSDKKSFGPTSGTWTLIKNNLRDGFEAFNRMLSDRMNEEKQCRLFQMK